MTAGIIVYFITIAALLLFDGVWVFVHAKGSDSPIYECNFIRYIRPIELLLCMFAITMLELVVQYFELVTRMFVNYTTIFLAVFSVAYVVDFILKEIKLKEYKFIIIKTGKSEFKSLTEGMTVKTHLDDSYMMNEEIKLLSSTLGQKPNIKILRNYLTTRVVMASFMIIAMIASLVAMATIEV